MPPTSARSPPARRGGRAAGRLTAGRRRVLEIVRESPAPMGAYEILSRMNAAGGRHAPAAVYRALGFLVAQGLLHRLESLNAWVACRVPGESHSAQFLLCRRCGAADEIDSRRIAAAIREGARSAGYAVESPVVEVAGLCPKCRDDRVGAAD